KSTYGFKAWLRLLSVASLEDDVEKSRALVGAARTRSCATTPEEGVIQARMCGDTIGNIDYVGAYKAFEDAEKMPDGPARAARWREAAALYRTALEHAP